MNNRTLKDLLYEQVARVGKALASPKRLEMLEMLAQGEKSVDALAEAVAVDIKLASAHLKALKEARLVVSRRDGKRMLYRLSGQDVAQLGVTLGKWLKSTWWSCAWACSNWWPTPHSSPRSAARR